MYLVGSVALVALAGCGRSFFQVEEREAWRHEAEVRCLESGSVKESSALVRMSAIEGPGICGADFPLKVAALGESTMLGYADELRPPGTIPNVAPAQPRWPLNPPRAAAPPEPYYPPPQQRYSPAAAPGAPLSISPPGVADVPAPYEEAEPYQPTPPSYPQERPVYGTQPSYPPAASYPASRAPNESVPLGPARGPQLTGSIGPVEVKPAATLACPIVSALDQWIAATVQPAAMRWFGQPVVEIKQISAYSCRGMNGQPGAPISEHAFGNALDIAAFTLSDGRQVVVQKGWNGLPEEQGFLHDVQGGACHQFTTVLAPGSNSFHYNHIHVDLMRRASGRQICQPAAIPGEVAAARASKRNGSYAQGAGPLVTGSIAKPMARPVSAFGREEKSARDMLDD